MRYSLYHLFTRFQGRWQYTSSHRPSYGWSEYYRMMQELYGAKNVRVRFTLGDR